MEINEFLVSFRGKTAISPAKKMTLGQDIKLTVRGSVLQIEEKDNQEGTKDLTYIIKLTDVE